MEATENIDLLVQRLADKDITALEELHKNYRGRLFGWARRYVNTDWDAEEVVQDVLWTLYRKADTFRGDSNFWTWTYRVTQNAARMHNRKGRRAPEPIDDDIIEYALNNADDAPTPSMPDEELDAEWAMQRMQAGLAELSDENRALYQAIEVHGVERSAVAEAMGISEPAVKARLHRIRVALRGAFAAAA